MYIMKRFFQHIKIALILSPALLLSSCGECPINLTAQRCENIIEAGNICSLYKEGKISSSEASKKLDKLSEEYKDLTRELEEIFAEYRKDPAKMRELNAEIASFDQSTEARIYKEKMQRSMLMITEIAKGLYDDSVPDQDIISAVERYNKQTSIYYL